MGGYGSGRYGGRPTADMSKRIDIAWLIRTGRVVPGEQRHGGISWSYGDEPSGSIGFTADMRDPESAFMKLNYARGPKDNRETVEQHVWLTFTEPHYGGRRWWMRCPFKMTRCGKLYMPNGGDRFASREAWRLGYNSQRVAHRDRPFEKLFRLQKKLSSDQGWEQPLYRPKGMWQRTYERHLKRYWELNHECDVEMAYMMSRLTGIGDVPNWLE